MKAEESWHLSKSVPATLIVGLITQGAAIVWTVSMMMGDIETNTKDIDMFYDRIGEIEDMVQSQAVSMARIDTNIMHIRGAVEKMAER
tara:strand:+ start:31 stop:294 length:264 start_codon:yes stop_codon:yes gene_type:complete